VLLFHFDRIDLTTAEPVPPRIEEAFAEEKPSGAFFSVYNRTAADGHHDPVVSSHRQSVLAIVAFCIAADLDLGDIRPPLTPTTCPIGLHQEGGPLKRDCLTFFLRRRHSFGSQQRRSGPLLKTTK
jgi:hypothetical protein